jgi:hypothetical protein
MDPRVKTSAADLAQQFKTSEDLYGDARTVSAAMEQVTALRSQIKELQKPAPKEISVSLTALDQKLQTFAGGEAGRGGRGGDPKSLAALRGALLGLMGLLQEADVAPTTQALAAAADLKRAQQAIFDSWQLIKTQDIAAMNEQLRNSKMPELRLDATSSGTH